jgi:hypothetical protein
MTHAPVRPRAAPGYRPVGLAPGSSYISVIPEGVGPVNSGLLFVIFLLAALRLLLGAPG